MEFYDVGAKKRFNTEKFRMTTKDGRHFAVAKSPFGNYECWRVTK